MSPIIVISSSPVRTFARSPTQVEFSSPPKPSQESPPKLSSKWTSTAAYSQLRSSRDRFSTGFTTAKHVLSPRHSAENVPIAVASPPKFKLTTPRSDTCEQRRNTKGIQPKTLDSPEAYILDPLSADEERDRSAGSAVKHLPSDARKRGKGDENTPLQLEQAVTRKKEWTPEKPHCFGTNLAEDGLFDTFGVDLAEKFGHKEVKVFHTKVVNAHRPIVNKRRKLSPADESPGMPVMRPPTTATSFPGAKVPKARTKSPVKKGLTITGLATSNYAGDSKDEASPMLQYLASTQARAEGDEDFDTFETKVKKTTKQNKGKTRSSLKSPRTAMKTAQSQEVIFATASQLARDDSPSLIRDTIEALKLSVENTFSSPVRTQQTAVFSVESTTPPKVGISRYRSRNSLWSAADRDENDAIFHVDDETGISFLEPEGSHLGTAFVNTDDMPSETAKDSMALLAALEPAQGMSFDTADSPKGPSPILPLTKAPPQARQYSTMSKHSSSKRRKDAENDTADLTKLHSRSDGSPVRSPEKKPIPPMPNYAMWTDEELKDACNAHGLKRLRARKSMIDKLCERFAEQHGLNTASVKAAQKRAEQSAKKKTSEDVLGRVHDLAARPLIKPKKPRKKKPETKGIVVESRSPRPDDIFDLSDIENAGLNAWDRLAAIKVPSDEVYENKNKKHIDNEIDDINDFDDLPPSTAPVRGTGVKATKIRSKAKDKAKSSLRPLTPPPTIPAPTQTQQSSPGFEELSRKPRIVLPSSPQPMSPYQKPQSPAEIPPSPEATGHKPIIDTLTSPSSSVIPDEEPLSTRILEAMKHPPANNDTRNHYKNPTWYEKILLYDPIVLEDLTAWLNTEGFNAIGEDREIAVYEVRDWCHANGICCLWKGGWRGNKKARKAAEGDDE